MNKENQINLVRIEQYNFEEIPLKSNNGKWTFRQVNTPKGYDKNILFSAEV